MAEKKEKRYMSDNAQLMAEWNWERNTDFDPVQLTLGSNKKVWWRCSQGHEWQATIYDRYNGNGCPYCSGRKALKGYNDLSSVNPTLAEEWNWERNNDLSPIDVTPNSNRKVWWKCSKGHEWQAIIANRHKGSACPYCSGRCAVKGKNDLKTANPALANEWNYEKNSGLTPAEVTPNSGQRLWWKCGAGHEWQARVADRNKGKGCPYCAGQKVLRGYNDLQTVNPALSREWNYERNDNLRPNAFTANSNEKVWWKCRKGHEWQATISHRNNGRGCPICDSERHTSFPEYALVYYLRIYGLEVIHQYKEKGYELDVFIPSRKIAIEYDGYRWHKNKMQQDLIKNSRCVEDGIRLYRIREGLLPLNDSSLDFIVQRNQKNLSEILEVVLSEILETDIDVDINRDFVFIENLRVRTEKDNSILFSNPEIVQEWDYEKNGNLKPENYTAKSARKVWWKCAKGHSWQAMISNRNKGHGCPYCAGLYVIKGENDLQTVNPLLAKEWNYEKNSNLKPDDFTASSGKKVWWKCTEGHEWETAISNRLRGTGCPYCSGNKVLTGYNDLQTINPTLAAEFDISKNNGSTPGEYFPKSGKTVWWLCSKCRYSWSASIIKRTNGQGCPQCAKEKRNKTK